MAGWRMPGRLGATVFLGGVTKNSATPGASQFFGRSAHISHSITHISRSMYLPEILGVIRVHYPNFWGWLSGHPKIWMYMPAIPGDGKLSPNYTGTLPKFLWMVEWPPKNMGTLPEFLALPLWNFGWGWVWVGRPEYNPRSVVPAITTQLTCPQYWLHPCPQYWFQKYCTRWTAIIKFELEVSMVENQIKATTNY
jgi:hypothetical protein